MDVEEALRVFEMAPENTSIVFTDKIAATKWSIDKIKPRLDSTALDPIVALKAAYEFPCDSCGRCNIW
jgi:hypothetical protein